VGVEGVVAALLISCVTAMAEDTKPINFSGDWWNNRCGLATLVEQGSVLSGVFIPSSGLEAGQKLSRTRLCTIRRNTTTWCRSAAFSASNRLFDWNGETKTIRTKHSSAIIVR
jgi:hypothetical protein